MNPFILLLPLFFIAARAHRIPDKEEEKPIVPEEQKDYQTTGAAQFIDDKGYVVDLDLDWGWDWDD